MFAKIIKIILALFTVIIVLFAFWFCLEFYLPAKNGPKEILLEIKRGQKVADIAQALKKNHIIRKKWPFLIGYKIFYSTQTLNAGEYKFQFPLSSKQALKTIIQGKIYLHPLTIPEGLTLKEIARYLESFHLVTEKDFIEAASNPHQIEGWDKNAFNLEGYLFPDTYHFPKGVTASQIVKAMVSQFKKTFNQQMKTRADQLGMTVRQVVILASLIEKETSIPEEKNLIAAVFHNRLRRGMKLDCDPTIIYALKQEERFTGRLRWKDLKLNSPYNTYLYPGLPPSPICNPGLGSLQAALYPVEENFLYFVSKNDGSHYFSRSLKEHLRAVRKYQK